MLTALVFCGPVMGQLQKVPVECVPAEQAATVEETAELAVEMFQLAAT